MEKPQASIGLGIRYAYDFNRGMRLSLAANYQLYKEKINTRAILDSMGQLYQVDYRLYSHFHVLTTQLELGKRWRWHDWFGDILGGAGMKWHQVSEVDYFTGEGKLADEDLVSRSYRPSTEPYVLGQAAVGKFLSPSLFCRMGVQVQSGFDLTSRDATVRHRIVPAHLFFEIGQRF